MNLLAPQDLLPVAEYEQQREQFRSQIIALKQRRRISVGPLITLVFENRETLRFQTQEMIRVEHILDPHKVQEELDVYNALMPGSGELSATLLIEITEQDRMKEWLDVFMGLDHGQTVAIRRLAPVCYADSAPSRVPRRGVCSWEHARRVAFRPRRVSAEVMLNWSAGRIKATDVLYIQH
jgi:hypothetical protein